MNSRSNYNSFRSMLWQKWDFSKTSLNNPELIFLFGRMKDDDWYDRQWSW